jgi:hypothetical protein
MWNWRAERGQQRARVRPFVWSRGREARSFSQSFVNSPKREADATSGAPKRRSRGMAMRHAVMRRGMTSHTFDATVMCAGPINHAVVHVRDRARPSDKLNRGGLRQTEAAERYDHERASDYTQPLHGVSPLRPNRRDINRSSDGRLTVAFVVSPSGSLTPGMGVVSVRGGGLGGDGSPLAIRRPFILGHGAGPSGVWTEGGLPSRTGVQRPCERPCRRAM